MFKHFDFLEMVFVSDECLNPYFFIWNRLHKIHVAADSTRKWKVETRSADSKSWLHASYFNFMQDTVRGYVPALIRFMEGRGALGPLTLTFRLRLRLRDMQHFKTNPFDIFRRLLPVNFFSINSHFTRL